MPLEYYEFAALLGGFLAICSLGLLLSAGVLWLYRWLFPRPMATYMPLIRRHDDYQEY